MSGVDEDTLHAEMKNVSTIDAGFVPGQARDGKPLRALPPVHKLVKQRAAEKGTSVFHETHLVMCRGLSIDPITLQPIAVTPQ